MKSLEEIKGIGPALAELLAEAGFDTADKISRANVADLVAVKGIGKALAQRLIDVSRDTTPMTVRTTIATKTFDGPIPEHKNAKTKKLDSNKPSTKIWNIKKSRKLSPKEEKAKLLKKLKKVQRALKRLDKGKSGKKK